MATNSNNYLKFREYDFANLKSNLSSFLKNQDVLSDYDINGSVLDTIISVLAYNTQNNAITANALFAESFVDSAVNRKNISMHAKHFSYVPYSINAAKAVVNLDVVVDLASSPSTQLTIEKGTVFTGQVENDTATFVTRKPYTADLVGDTYSFKDVELYQGSYGSIDILVDKSRISNVYEIKVDNIDLSFLEVYVQDAIDSTNFELWDYAQDSILVNGDSKVFFMQETANGKYAIEFGDGVLGKSVADGITVRVVYLVTTGKAGNNVSSFKFSYAPNEYSKINGPSYTTTVTTTEKSSGGFSRESDESVKKNAPKFYVAQNRGVVAQDYEDLIRIKFPYINSISVWSGKDGSGIYDQFGRIYISANTAKSHLLTTSQKNDIYNAVIEKYGIAGVIPVLVDVDNTFIDVTTTVFVRDFVHITSSQVDDLVRAYVVDYNKNNLEQFEGEFRHSRFVAGIDDLDSVISSNITTVKLQKRVFPDIRVSTSFSLTFHNKISSLVTNSFTFGTNLKTVFMKADSSGQINVYEVIGDSEILVQNNVGFVDFKTGDVSVNNITIYKTNDATKDIRFFADPVVDNISSLRNNICVIDSVNITIERK